MANLKFGDRVREVTDTESTVDYRLKGVSDPLEQTFVVGIGDGNGCYYCCEDTTDWEIGYGVIAVDPGGQGYDTLTREIVYASSNNNEAVVWGVGSKTIFNTATAQSLDHIAGFVVNKSEISFNRTKFVATAEQDTFNFVYLPQSLEVRLNGLVLTEDQYSATNGAEVILNTPCTAGHVVEFMAIGQYSTTHSELSTPVPAGQIFKSGMFFNDVWRDAENVNDGIAVNCSRAPSKTSVEGDAVALNGVGSHIDMLDLGFVHSGAFSFALWATTATTLTDATLVSNQSVDDTDGYFHIRTAEAGNLEVAVLDSGGAEQTITTAVSVNTEYHIVVIYNGAELTLWVNGVAETPLTVAIKPTTPVNDLSFGHRLYPTPSAFCEAKVCGVNIYDFALTDDQVALVYSEPDEPDTTTLGAIVVPGGSSSGATEEFVISMAIALG